MTNEEIAESIECYHCGAEIHPGEEQWDEYGRLCEGCYIMYVREPDDPNVYTGACFVAHSRMGSSVYVGPFTSVKKARKWIKHNPVGWVIVLLQDPTNLNTPDWS